MRMWINGRIWTVADAADPRDDAGDPCFGTCAQRYRRIEIKKDQRERDRLDTLIHELGHAIGPKATEKEVTATAKVLTDALWRDGWRRT